MTAVYVTHDQAEAMALATRIAVMDKGRIVQFAPPIEIYRRPSTTFVANFVGNPPMNLVSTEAAVADGRLQLRADGLTLPGLSLSDAIAAAAKGGRMTLGVRPEHLRIARAGDENTITGKLLPMKTWGPKALSRWSVRMQGE